MIAVMVAGCAVTADDSPRLFEGSDLVRIASEMATPATSVSPGTGEAVELWFVADDELVPVMRVVEVVTPEVLVGLLVAGPGADEADLRSAVASTAAVLDVSQAGETVRVNLSDDFALLGGAEELLAVGQVVATLTGTEGIERVSFALEDQDIAVPDGAGVLRDSLTRADVESLVRSSSSRSR